MNVKIINVWESQYDGMTQSKSFAPLTVPYLAALFPSDVNVTIHHEQIRPIDYDIDVDLIAITFLIANANHAYEIADRFRNRGVKVIMGGFHASLLPDEVLKHADSVVIGEAENLFPIIINDLKRGALKSVYKSENIHNLENLPFPRYDLLENDFVLTHSIQATRGCPYKCEFCSIISFNSGFRVRPIDEVIRDITCYEGRNYLQNKIVMFWDNNLTGNKQYAKELFRKMIPLKKRWFSQLSIDMVRDKELMRLAAESGCASVFIGIESFSQESLKSIKKNQNKIADYKKAIRTFHDFGIYVMAGLIIGFDEDTVDSISKIPDIVQEVGIDMPFVSILTPNYGTGLYERYSRENRIFTKDWSRYNAFNAVFHPKNISVEELHSAYLDIWKELHSVPKTITRVFKGIHKLWFWPFLWSLVENGYYSSQNVMGNYPFIGVNGKKDTEVNKY